MSWSLSSIETSIQAALVRDEAAVTAIATDIAKGVEVALSKLQGAGNWLAANAPQIEAGISGAATFAEAMDAPISPALLAASAAANASLQAFAAAHNAGQSTPSSVVQGLVAYKLSAGLISQATATAIQTKAASTISAISTAAAQVAATPGLGSAVTGAASAIAVAASTPAA